MKKRTWTIFLLALLVALGLAGSSAAETAESQNATETAANEDATDEAAAETLTVRGMQIFKDAVTGEMRAPTAKEAAALSKQLRELFGKREVAEPQGFTLKNGTTMWEIDPSYFKFSVARIAADGSVVTDCVQGPQKTLDYIEASSTTNGPAEE